MVRVKSGEVYEKRLVAAGNSTGDIVYLPGTVLIKNNDTNSKKAENKSVPKNYQRIIVTVPFMEACLSLKLTRYT